MEAINIQQIGGFTSNAHMSTRSIELVARIKTPYFKPDGDGWEEVWIETTTVEVNKGRMRVRGPRKQQAARRVVPINVIKVEKPKETVSYDKAMEILNAPPVKAKEPKVKVPIKVIGKSANDIAVESLEAQIAKLQALLGIKK